MAEICSESTSISVPPFLERTKVRNTRVKLDLSPPDPLTKPNNDNSVAKILREKVFKFPEAAIAKIKSTVNSTPASNGSKLFSTFQSLGAHIWRHATRARELNPEDYTVFTIFIDCRKRVNPAMPESYFGNLIQAIFTVLPAGLLSGKPRKAFKL
ncbi:unnamed protein product [Linum tenue]|uniref:Uncharacterized protein n=1 Tax=Linum tenue TaxID=586396 RepID=A0AAV0J1E7_9ROSI|nr:unnamed protein product [Linum tenue]